MTKSRTEIQAKVNSIIAEIIEADSANFDETAELINDLEFDSMCFLELSIQIQREYGIFIVSPEWEHIKTLKELYDVIISKLETDEKD
jgi:acyl carrier protein